MKISNENNEIDANKSSKRMNEKNEDDKEYNFPFKNSNIENQKINENFLYKFVSKDKEIHDKIIEDKEKIIKDSLILKEKEETQNPMEEDEKPLYVMNIELEKGVFKYIKIYKNTIPEELAYEFCKENKLDINSLNYLTENISHLLENNTKNKDEFIIQEVDEENQEEVSLEKNKYKDEINKKLFLELDNRDDKEIKLEKIKNNILYFKHYVKENLDKNELINKEDQDILKDSKTSKFNNKSNKLFFYLEEKEKKDHFIKDKNVFKKLYKQNIKNNSNNKINFEENIKDNQIKITELNDSKYLNNGERIYWKNLNLKEESTKNNLKIGNILEAIDKLNRPFNPEINIEKNVKLLKNRYNSCNSDEFLQSYHFIKENKINIIKSKLINNEDHYTFNPKVNKNFHENEELHKNKYIHNQYGLVEEIDKYTLDNRSKSYNNSHIKLYNLSKNKSAKIKMKEMEIYKNFIFKPILNNKYKLNSIENNSLSSVSFENRLEFYKNKREKNMKKLKEENEKKIGDFKPKINIYKGKNEFNNLYQEEENNTYNEGEYSQFKISKNINTINTTSLNQIENIMIKNTDNKSIQSKDKYLNTFISNYIYSQKKLYNKKKKTEGNDKIILQSSNKHHTNNETNEIYENLKIKSFRKIFKQLDSDNDNIISFDKIELNTIPNEVINVLLPILNELKEEKESLNENEFIQACDQLFKIIDFQGRKLLIKIASNKYIFNSYNSLSKSYSNDRLNTSNIS